MSRTPTSPYSVQYTCMRECSWPSPSVHPCRCPLRGCDAGGAWALRQVQLGTIVNGTGAVRLQMFQATVTQCRRHTVTSMSGARQILFQFRLGQGGGQTVAPRYWSATCSGRGRTCGGRLNAWFDAARRCLRAEGRLKVLKNFNGQRAEVRTAYKVEDCQRVEN